MSFLQLSKLQNQQLTTKKTLQIIMDGAILSSLFSITFAIKKLLNDNPNKLIKFTNIKLLICFTSLILLQCIARHNKPLVFLRHTYFQKMFCYFLVSFIVSAYPIFFLTHNGFLILLNYFKKIDEHLKNLKKFCEIVTYMYI